MKTKSVAYWTVTLLFIVFPWRALGQELKLTAVEFPATVDKKCTVTFRVEGPLDKASDLKAEIYWVHEYEHKRSGTKMSMAREYEAKRVDPAGGTVEFRIGFADSRPRRGICRLKYTLNATEMKTNEVQSAWFNSIGSGGPVFHSKKHKGGNTEAADP